MTRAARIDARRSSDGADLIIQTNMDGLITYMSASVEHLTGYKREAFVGRPVSDLVGVETAVRLSEAVRRRIRYPERRITGVEHSLIHKQGHKVWFEARPSPLIDAITRKQIGVTDVLRDITESRAARTSLEFANVLLKIQMEASPSAILVVDADSRIVSYNQNFLRLWNMPLSHLIAKDGDAVEAVVRAQLADGEAVSDRLDWVKANHDKDSREEIATRDGRFIDAYSVPMRAPGGANLGRAFFFQDITDHKRALAQALHKARFDGLTGLANRDVFVDAVKSAIAAAKRGAGGFSVFFLDLDHFKTVNDTLGHPVGDELLKQLASRLKANLREVDLVARFGGDEFAVIISNVEERAQVATLAAKLVCVLGSPYYIHDRVVRSSASLGIETFGPDAPNVEMLLLHADIALYRAKADCPGSYRFFTEELGSKDLQACSDARCLHGALGQYGARQMPTNPSLAVS